MVHRARILLLNIIIILVNIIIIIVLLNMIYDA